MRERHGARARANFHLVAPLATQPIAPATDLYKAGNSYIGLLRQATRSHHTRCRVANKLRRRGLAVDFKLTKVYAP